MSHELREQIKKKIDISEKRRLMFCYENGNDQQCMHAHGELEAYREVLVLLGEYHKQLQDQLEKELRRMWSESDTQMIMAVVDEVLRVEVKKHP